jgi:Trypsin
VLVTGWGVTLKDHESNEALRGVVVATVNQDKCSQAYKYDGRWSVTNQIVCASVPGKDSCSVSFQAICGDDADRKLRQFLRH